MQRCYQQLASVQQQHVLDATDVGTADEGKGLDEVNPGKTLE